MFEVVSVELESSPTENSEGASEDSETPTESKSASKAKPKKARNTAGLLAAAAKRREANAQRKQEAEKAKEQAVRDQYTQQYQSLKTQIGESSAQPYSMKSVFQVASAVKHPNFGLGFVTVSTSERIEVAFESGVRQLIHNRK